VGGAGINMARRKTQENQLSAYFTQDSFVVESGYLQLEEMEEPLKTWFQRFYEDKYTALYHLGFLEREKWFSPALEYLHYISELLIGKIGQQSDLELNRDAIQVDIYEEETQRLIEGMPFVIGMEYVDDAWIKRLWEALFDVFRKEIKAYDGTVARYLEEYNSNINVVGRVFFHLVESKDEHYPFAFMATYTTKPIKSKRAVHTPLKNALKEFDEDEKKLLSLISTVIKAAEKSNFLSDLLESGELFSAIKFTANEAYTFLKEVMLYEEAGIMCRVPDWWRKSSNSLSLSIIVGEKEPSKVGLDAIMDFSPAIKVGDDSLSEKELRDFLKMAEGLVLYKGKWVEINQRKMEALLQAFDKVKDMTSDSSLSLSEAMRLELNVNQLLEGTSEDIDVSISNGQWLRSIKETLTNPVAKKKLAPVPSFQGTLRAYQKNGYQWLSQMSQLGLGACLADDMGLGKTVQLIAFL
jgi:SNF2 family DNA or RNA helicase